MKIGFRIAFSLLLLFMLASPVAAHTQLVTSGNFENGFAGFFGNRYYSEPLGPDFEISSVSPYEGNSCLHVNANASAPDHRWIYYPFVLENNSIVEFSVYSKAGSPCITMDGNAIRYGATPNDAPTLTELILSPSHSNWVHLSTSIYLESGFYCYVATINKRNSYYLDNISIVALDYDVEAIQNNTINFDSDVKRPGETLKVITRLADTDLSDDNYYVTLAFPTADGKSSIVEYNLTSAVQVNDVTVPTDAASGTRNQYLYGWDQGVLDWKRLTILGDSGTPSIGLDNDQYFSSDTVKLSYHNLPTNATLEMYLRDADGDEVKRHSFIVTGTGIKTIPLENTTATRISAIASKGTEILSQTTARIISGDYFITGKIYDATNGAPVPEALVNIDGTMATTDSLGVYSIITSPGFKTVIITKNGYQQYHAFTNITKLNTYKNFYIARDYTATSGEGTSLSGIVTDRLTGDPLSGTYIKIQKGDVTHSAMSSSSSGRYVFDSEDLTGIWTVTATKTGYDTYTTEVNLTSDTYLQITMVNQDSAASYNPDDVPGGPDDSGSSTDRPSRAAAKESLNWLEGFMPNVIKLVVLIFLLALMGVKL